MSSGADGQFPVGSHHTQHRSTVNDNSISFVTSQRRDLQPGHGELGFPGAPETPVMGSACFALLNTGNYGTSER